MVLGWRRTFCTSIPPDREPPVIKEKQEYHHHQQSNTTDPSPKLSSKFGRFFSNPTTPRLKTPPASSPGLRCRTTATATATATVTAASVTESPKLQCNTAKNSPRFFHPSSNPSSPHSPSTFSLLKSSLRLSKSRCGICLQSVKTGQGMAIFTAECLHTFHFPCIASHMKKQSQMECPVCSSIWKEMPLLSIHNQKSSLLDQKRREIAAKIDVNIKANINERKHYLRSDLKAYNDDEPLMSPTSVARFNPIPESDENGDEDSEIGAEEFQGFNVNASTSPIEMNSKNVEVGLSPEAAVVSIGRSYETYAIILKVRAPPAPEKASHRAPIDLVTVIDVSGSMNSEKMQMMKRAMRLVVSSLSSVDRLSIVAFSATSKRLLPLRRMTTNGRRSVRRIIDPLVVLEGTSSASDALKKAAKVLEDRRERNPAVSIILLSDRHDDRSSANHQRRRSLLVSSTRYAHLDIPVHSIGFNHDGMCGHAPTKDAFVKCVGDLLSVVVQDLRLQLGFTSGSAPAEIAAVYSYTPRASALGSGSPKVGDLYAEEERELLVELKVPSSTIEAHHVLSVRCNYLDPSTQEVVHGKEQALLVPHPRAVKSSAPSIQRLRNLFLTTRALAESRRLVERSDLTGAHHMLSSARALLLQSSSASAKEFINSLKAELSELHRRCQSQNQRSATTLVRRREIAFVDEKGEPLTSTSAWRAAERLAKVGIMRKSLNRVSDLHGLEDARF